MCTFQQQKNHKYRNKQESMAHSQEQNQSTEIVPKKTQTLKFDYITILK